MKIGIMTFWQTKWNYGEILQCYALQKYLRDAGYDTYLIQYEEGNEYSNNNVQVLSNVPKPYWKKVLKIFNPIKIGKYLLSKKQELKSLQEFKKNDGRNFEEFRNKNIQQSEKSYRYYSELKKNPPKADVYIVGSDQVWNTDILKGLKLMPQAYFLDFGNSNIKRISYAASFGKIKIEKDFADLITPLLQKFNYVSVREKSGLDICKQCGITNADWVPDPTMLLDADIYRTLYKNEPLRKPNKKYCFFYYLGDVDESYFKSIYDWSKKKNLKVIYISAHCWQRNNYKQTYATVPEWIYLLEHSEYVITNSFHCCVFSLIFEKKFGFLPYKGKITAKNDRIFSLFELFDMDKRILDSDFSVLDKNIDWQNISKIFQGLRNNNPLIMNLCR